MAEFEKNGLLIQSRFDQANQIVAASVRSRKILVPAFNIHLRSIVESMHNGRHSVDITVEDVKSLVRRQRAINRNFQSPYNLVNDLSFVFEQGSQKFTLFREISGDKGRYGGEINL